MVPSIPGEKYGTLEVISPWSDRPVARQADFNIGLRGFVATKETLDLIDYTGDADGGAPQLAGLFGDKRTPPFKSAYKTYDWNWSCNCRGDPISDPAVTLLGLGTTPGEVIYLPGAGGEIGMGYQALVIYAETDRIVLKYTRKDGVADGYTLHIGPISVEPSLLALYQRMDQAGRSELPALRTGQAFGRARGGEIQVAIRDTGSFMDPRSRKDWWRGR